MVTVGEVMYTPVTPLSPNTDNCTSNKILRDEQRSNRPMLNMFDLRTPTSESRTSSDLRTSFSVVSKLPDAPLQCSNPNVLVTQSSCDVPTVSPFSNTPSFDGLGLCSVRSARVPSSFLPPGQFYVCSSSWTKKDFGFPPLGNPRLPSISATSKWVTPPSVNRILPTSRPVTRLSFFDFHYLSKSIILWSITSSVIFSHTESISPKFSVIFIRYCPS